MNTHMKLLLSGAAVSCLMLPMPVMAQSSDGANAYDEITVTARKREETLTEVPVSISVLNEALIEDTGILTQADLFTLVPGIQYDEPFDRNSASPSIRGVQSNEVATNRTKVTQFIDGMPVLGSQGNIQFGSVQQVEVFRGPQSAAFGRSTFGGAINYVTKDPGDEFEADASLDVNDFGTRRLGFSLGGPVAIGNLGDTLGYRFDYQKEDSTAPSRYDADDGSTWGERSSDAWSGKLVWTPTDALTAEFAYSYVESADSNRGSFILTEDATNACWDGTDRAGMGPNPTIQNSGVINCDWGDIESVISQGDFVPNVLADIDAGLYSDFNGNTVLAGSQIATDLEFLANASSIPDGQEGAFDERTRFQTQIDYEFDNGSLIQFSGFVGEEEYIRIVDGSQDPRTFSISPPMSATGLYTVSAMGPGSTIGTFMADPSEIEEKYAEVRYVSPGDDALRYVVGASFYDYTFETKIFEEGYNALINGQADDYLALTGTDVSGADQIFAEDATNWGIYGNVSYDFSEKLTATFEARFQSDTVGGFSLVDDLAGNEAEIGGELTTEAFLPRLSVNYNIDDETSVYAQYARGNNPAGVNVGFFDPSNVAQLDCQDTNGVLLDGVTIDADGNFTVDATSIARDVAPNGEALNSFNGVDTCGQLHVGYSSSDFQFYEEETIDNYEIGAKGRLFDGKVDFAVAAFYMDWKNQGRSANLNWGNPALAMGGDDTGNRTFVNEGDIDSKGVEFEGTVRLTDDFSVRFAGSYLDATYADFCDVALEGNNNNGGADPDAYDQLIIDNTVLVTDAGNDLGYSCVDVSGNDVVDSSKLTGSVSPSYQTELTNGLRFDARADIRYEGSQYLDTLNSWESDPVTTVNVSSGLSGDRWGLTLYVNNLFDEDQPLRYGSETYYAENPQGESRLSYTPRAERTIGLRARVNY